MRVGSLVYATDQGLGILAKSFYDAGVVTDVMVVRHGRHPTHEEWYPGAKVLGSLADSDGSARRWCEDMDVMLFFETPFIWPLVDHCRRKGVKTALMPMFECEHERLPAQPDLFINPSHLDQRYYPQGIHIPVPVEYPWRQRTRAEVFVHNAGHGGLKGRNGTKEFVEACKLVKSPAKLILRAQESSRQYWAAEALRQGNELPSGIPSNLEVICKTVPYEELFATGDVFVFPEKFNGLSLPLQEARAAGMLVMCGDRFPMNQWLPRNWYVGYEKRLDVTSFESKIDTVKPIMKDVLIPVAGYNRGQRIGPPYQPFDEAIIRPEDIAAKIDEWFGRDISEYSLQGKSWAETMSWERLKPEYMRVLEELVG